MSRLEETRPDALGRARGLVSGRVSGARVQSRWLAPPSDLAHVVEALWFGRWDLPADEPHRMRLLGDPCIHVVVSWGESDLPPARIVGVWTRTWTNDLRLRGTARGFKLRAGAAGALLAAPSAVRDRVVPIAALFEGELWVDDLGPAEDDDARAFERIGAWLRPRLRAGPDTELAVRACERLRSDGGLLRVDALASAVGLTERGLQRLFRLHVGAPPKALIRRHRLQEAAARLERRDATSLAELALSLGYADQAHFARDWKDAVSVTPRVFADEVHTR
ncbi:MAG: AraC family transcriptional regulator [Myxococcales bacterium]|nr:AraC family transcriptional regulator [Myxococcales bacterium]